MYVVGGAEQGGPRGKLQGTVQNDILKEFIARGTYIYPIEPSLRLATDVCRFVTDAILAARDLFEDGLARVRAVAVLVHVREHDGLAHVELPGVRLLVTHDHLEERRLARAVRADHADDPGGWQRERQFLEEQPVAEALRDAVSLDHDVAEPRPGRDVDLDLVEPHGLLLREELLVRAEARL